MIPLNIPNHDGIEAAKQKLNAQSDKPIAAKLIISFFPDITSKSFHFQQHQLSPKKRLRNGNHLCIIIREHFMGKFESTHFYPYIRDKAATYLRYIDDIWKLTEEEPLS